MEHIVSASVESDTFLAFNTLMSETRDLFIRQMDSTSTGLFIQWPYVIHREGVLLQFEDYLKMHVPQSFARLVFVFMSLHSLERTWY